MIFLSGSPQPLKSPGVAAVLGFLIPGVGQMYNGQFGKGALFLLVNVVNGLLVFAYGIGFVTGLLWAIFSAWDAYRAAEASNRRAVAA